MIGNCFIPGTQILVHYQSDVSFCIYLKSLKTCLGYALPKYGEFDPLTNTRVIESYVAKPYNALQEWGPTNKSFTDIKELAFYLLEMSTLYLVHLTEAYEENDKIRNSTSKGESF